MIGTLAIAGYRSLRDLVLQFLVGAAQLRRARVDKAFELRMRLLAFLLAAIVLVVSLGAYRYPPHEDLAASAPQD